MRKFVNSYCNDEGERPNEENEGISEELRYHDFIIPESSIGEKDYLRCGE